MFNALFQEHVNNETMSQNEMKIILFTLILIWEKEAVS